MVDPHYHRYLPSLPSGKALLINHVSCVMNHSCQQKYLLTVFMNSCEVVSCALESYSGYSCGISDGGTWHTESFHYLIFYFWRIGHYFCFYCEQQFGGLLRKITFQCQLGISRKLLWTKQGYTSLFSMFVHCYIAIFSAEYLFNRFI